MSIVAKFVVFRGSVQGVGFRYTAHRIATRYELTGYVRNCSDGSVEMFAQGAPDDVQSCVDDIRDTFSSYVRKIDITDADLRSDCTEFMIKV